MNDDVTIPRETAQRFARELRHGGMTPWTTDALADILDPPQRSLRDEVAAYLADHSGYNSTSLMDRDAAEDILALVRKRVLRLPRHKVFQRGWHVRLDDLIALLGGES